MSRATDQSFHEIGMRGARTRPSKIIGRSEALEPNIGPHSPALSPEFELESFLTAAIRSGPPARHVRAADPVARAWPACGPYDPVDASRIERHPLLTSPAFSRCEEFQPRRRSKSASPGWQGKFYSWKMRRTLHARSRLELHLMEICEVDADVVAFLEQPVRLRYEELGRARRYTPDLYVESRRGSYFAEVKWEGAARAPHNESRWPLIAKPLNRWGFGFEVLTERHILRQPRADNVKALLRSRFSPDAGADTRNVLADQLRAGPSTIGNLQSALGLTRKDLFRLLLEGRYPIDLDQPLGPATKVKPQKL